MWPNSTCELNKFKYNQLEEALTQILVVFKNVSLYMPLQKFKLPFWSNLPQEIILLYKLKYKIPTCKDAHKFKLFFWPMGFENILKFCSFMKIDTTPMNHDFNKLEFSPPEKDSKQNTSFVVK